jgi:hypothetical protein
MALSIVTINKSQLKSVKEEKCKHNKAPPRPTSHSQQEESKEL